MYDCTIVHVHVRRTMTKMMILFVGGQNGQRWNSQQSHFPTPLGTDKDSSLT